MRLTGSRLIEFRQQAQTLRDQGYSYPAIGYLLGKHHSVIMYHLKPDMRMIKRARMRHYGCNSLSSK